METYRYFNRDISWLSFNHRVLEEAKDPSVPLYERIHFLAIYSNNMEEFYRVRVSYYRSLLRELPCDHPKIEEVNPELILQEINSMVNKQQEEFIDIFQNNILPELRNNGIITVGESDKLSENHEKYIKDLFVHEILPYLQPVLLIKQKIRPFLKTGQIYLILEMYSKLSTSRIVRKSKLPRYGLVKLPTDHDIPRFIELPQENGKYHIIFLEDVIRRYVDKIFPGYFIHSWYTIKMTRDADLEYDDYTNDDLIEVIENISNRREVGKPNRFQYDRRIPNRLLKYLLSTFHISPKTLVKAGKHPNFRDFFDFPNPLSPALENEKLMPISLPKIEKAKSIFKGLKKKDFLLHFPYQTYDHFLQFLHEAIRDKKVNEIKATQYRVATNSAVVNALINAALMGKKVTVFVELKARFDEEANLKYAKEMKKAGINIIYSIPGLKVHAKVLLILRSPSEDKETADYAYLGTGNFNERTARSYSDQGLFTAHKGIIEDVKNFFHYLESRTNSFQFRHILVPHFNLIETFDHLIEQEVRHAQTGNHAYMCLKMNGLQDPFMIDKLYRASEKGVKIDLIIRGVCCLIPGEKFSKNIRIIRIVDRFLEHSRVFWFYNNGENTLYLGSADWMKRNLYRRVECVFPVYAPEIKNEIIDFLKIQLIDNTKARLIDNKLNNCKIKNDGPPVRAQMEMYNYLKNKYAE